MAKQKKKREKIPGLKKRLEDKSTKKRIKKAIRKAEKERIKKLKGWMAPDSWKGIVAFVYKMESEGYTYKEKRTICNNLQIHGGFMTYKLLKRAVYLSKLMHDSPMPPLYEWGEGYPLREVRKYHDHS